MKIFNLFKYPKFRIVEEKRCNKIYYRALVKEKFLHDWYPLSYEGEVNPRSLVRKFDTIQEAKEVIEKYKASIPKSKIIEKIN